MQRELRDRTQALAGSRQWRNRQYPTLISPDELPLTEFRVSHSSDALKRSRWFRSHAALWDEHPRSMNSFWPLPRSAYSSLTRSGRTCLSWAPATISVGAWTLATAARFHPHVVT